MKRSRTGSSINGFSLFPFLAVLLCTVGVLIVLLMLMVQMARVDAAEDPDSRDPLAPPDHAQVAKEDYEWRRELLEQQRDQVRQDIARKRLALSHLEEHIRELERRWEELRAQAADLQLRSRGQVADQDTSQAELQRLRAEIATAQMELEAARQKLASQPAAYAILPYNGPNSTRRRPIYLECTGQGVIIQPEGILLGASDFNGPLGPGNPLDAALRGIREHYVRTGSMGTHGEPYPLLIVRPDGIEAYAAARLAMQAWEEEFGYELVDQQMPLKYPDADPALGQLVQKIIGDARSRQEILAAAMPSRFERRESNVGFVASPTRGGFVRQGDAGDEPGGARRGGFGQGGDSRFAQGRASGPVSVAPPGSLPDAPASASGPAGAEGVAGATVGGGVSPMAKTRGQNWGLPQRAADATGIVRPIRVACLPDRLIILPDRDETRAPDMILIEGAMYAEVDALVSKIWARVEGWGLAVAGGYWKPVLNVQVADGAESRFEELRVLLDGSGLDVQRSDK
ncbi:MAG: hypothetical protein GXY58_17525 [Planctomycetaceae bacterium]|nr:hypothetical protein [Planctomycetaceae bacterium]